MMMIMMMMRRRVVLTRITTTNKSIDNFKISSHMVSTVYPAEASWVGGTILRARHHLNRQVDKVIYENFSTDLQRDLQH